MKKIVLFIAIILVSTIIKAQDTIVKINGDKIIAKVLEISTTEVKYKKYDILDGPTYIDFKSNVQMIIYANGEKDIFKKETTISNNQQSTDYYTKSTAPVVNVVKTEKIEDYGRRYRYQNHYIGESNMQAILLKTKDKEIISLVGKAKDARTTQYVGFAAIPFGVGALYFFLKSIIYSKQANNGSRTLNSEYLTYSGICIAGTIACPVISGIFKHKRTASNKKAIELYNQKY